MPQPPPAVPHAPPTRTAARDYNGPRLAQTRHVGPRGNPQGATTKNRPSTAPDALSGGAGRVVPRPWRLLGPQRACAWGRPVNPDTMPPKDRTRVQLCVWGVGYAGAATGLNGLTMGRGGKMAHDAPAPRPGRRRVVAAATWKSGAARSMREQRCRKKGDE